MRILIIEDHDDTRRVMARLLGRTYDIATASTLADAIRLCRAEKFDVAIIDIGLPDGDGWEMGAIANECGVKAIAVTGYGMLDDIAKSRREGFVKHVVKPISLNDLQSAIDEIVTLNSDYDRLPDNWAP